MDCDKTLEVVEDTCARPLPRECPCAALRLAELPRRPFCYGPTATALCNPAQRQVSWAIRDDVRRSCTPARSRLALKWLELLARTLCGLPVANHAPVNRLEVPYLRCAELTTKSAHDYDQFVLHAAKKIGRE